jgi:pilus assembly protein CpaE
VSPARILVLDRSDDLADQVRTALTDVDPLPEVVSCTRLGVVGEILEHDGPFDVLLAGPSLGTRSGLARLELVRHEMPAMSIVVAFSKRPEASLREIVRAGAVDVLQLPADDDQLADTVERALDLSRRLTGAVPATQALAAPATPPPAPSRAGKVFTVCSATGGCGKTFYVTNLAYFLAHHTGKRVCIVDLDLQFGEISTALRLRPQYTIHDLLNRGEANDVDLREHLEEYLVSHETGVSVLAAPRDPAEADHITPPDVTKVLEAVRSRFDYVIVDTPAQLSEVVLAAFDQSETLFGMVTLDLPSVRNMSVFLNTLEKLKIPADGVRIILNKEESDVGIDVAQIEKLFPQRFNSTLPYAKEVSRSINIGMPVLASAPQSELSRRMAAGMASLLPDQAQRQVVLGAASHGPGLFARLFKRRQPAAA